MVPNFNITDYSEVMNQTPLKAYEASPAKQEHDLIRSSESSQAIEYREETVTEDIMMNQAVS
jgi:hypothetical protein